MNKSKLIDVFQNDPFGLLNSTNKKNSNQNQENIILIDSFEEICTFFSDNNREPDDRNLIEFKLKARLESIRRDVEKVKLLIKYDFHGLLKDADIKNIGINDILNNDKLGILNVEDDDIFNLKFVKPSDRIRPDYLARRRVCKDFELFSSMFTLIHQDIILGKRRLIQFNEETLSPGKFFTLNGIVFFLEDVKGSTEKRLYSSGDRSRFDGRTRCIFDNGTESDMLYRSLVKAMLLDGFEISEPIKDFDESKELTDDVLNGYIYILKSKSNDRNILEFPDLHKIGYTTTSVTNRIKNARKEATYLFADVEIIATYRCLNVKTSSIENLIHTFFKEVRVEFDIIDSNGTKFKPLEWFSVPLDVISQAISIITSENIENYYFDTNIRQIVKMSK
jgi:hypothetical protein